MVAFLTRNKRVVLALAVLLLLAGSAGALWAYQRQRRLSEAQRLQQLLLREETRTFSPDQRKEQWERFRERFKQLTPKQREALAKARREQLRRQKLMKIDHYFSLGPAERIAFLDAEIDQMEARRRHGEREQREAEHQAARNPPSKAPVPSRPLPPPDPEREDQFFRRALERATPEDRAKLAEYNRHLRERRQQRER